MFNLQASYSFSEHMNINRFSFYVKDLASKQAFTNCLCFNPVVSRFLQTKSVVIYFSGFKWSLDIIMKTHNYQRSVLTIKGQRARLFQLKHWPLPWLLDFFFFFFLLLFSNVYCLNVRIFIVVQLFLRVTKNGLWGLSWIIWMLDLILY